MKKVELFFQLEKFLCFNYCRRLTVSRGPVKENWFNAAEAGKLVGYEGRSWSQKVSANNLRKFLVKTKGGDQFVSFLNTAGVVELINQVKTIKTQDFLRNWKAGNLPVMDRVVTEIPWHVKAVIAKKREARRKELLGQETDTADEKGVEAEMETSSCTALVRVDENNQVVVDSLMIAKQFGRMHKDVLKAIRNLNCSEKFNQRNFALSSYFNEQGKTQPMYVMTRDGCVFLITSLTGDQAVRWKERYITAFSKKEQELMDKIEILEATSECKDLVRVDENNHVVVDSLMIAKQFSRRHADVLLTISRLNCSEEFRERNFVSSYYVTSQGKTQPMYVMTRDGCVFLIAKLKGSQAGAFLEAYIAEFNRKEAELRQLTENPSAKQGFVDDMTGRMVIKTMEVMERVLGIMERLERKFDSPNYGVVSPPTHMTVLGYARMVGKTIDLKTAQALGRRATRLCHLKNMEIRSVQDERFELVNAYPLDVLKEIFKANLIKNKDDYEEDEDIED